MSVWYVTELNYVCRSSIKTLYYVIALEHLRPDSHCYCIHWNTLSCIYHTYSVSQVSLIRKEVPGLETSARTPDILGYFVVLLHHSKQVPR
jgi:hypothetical protein